MTRFVLRTDPADGPDEDEAVLLDAFASGTPGSTIRLKTYPDCQVDPPAPALDLLTLAMGVFAADRLARRRVATDGWSRDLSLSLASTTPAAIGAPGTARTLAFLTGDEWAVQGRPADPAQVRTPRVTADAVCLLSGGLDSLVGAINLLASEPDARVLFVGVQDASLSAGRQIALAHDLANRYPLRVTLQRAEFVLEPPSATQLRPLPAAREETTRSRSLLFIGYGLACASAIGSEIPLYVPENGFIGLNVPLVASRSGSASTRTTHPRFMDGLCKLAGELGVPNEIRNPLRLLTKGEALAQCRDQATLRTLAPTSVSCAHPTASRWAGGTTKPCGYCYPCLIRRASMHAIGLDSGPDYWFDVLRDADFMVSTGSRPASLRALLAALHGRGSTSAVLANGPLPRGEVADFAGLYARGRDELEAWLRTATAPELLARLP